MNRWTQDDVVRVLDEELPRGLVDLWATVPAGHHAAGDALRALGAEGQRRIVQSLGALEQKAIAAVGMAVGFRPEVFERVRELPGVDVAQEVALALMAGSVDVAALTDATQKLVVDILERVGDRYQASSAVVNSLGALGLIVEVVWGSIKLVVDEERAWAAAKAASRLAALDCPPVSYSAEMDRSITLQATRLLERPTWGDLFLPTVRPVSTRGEVLGFTCCPLTTDGGRMVAPVGNGWGNKSQSMIGNPGHEHAPETYGEGLGYGCLPMCPELPVHRALIVPKNREPYDAGRGLPQLAGVGQIAWRLLWGRGPATYCVDGPAIADAWLEYLSLMRGQILDNDTGFGTLLEPVCGSWGPGRSDQFAAFSPGRRKPLAWFYERIGVSREALDEGVYLFEHSAPVSAWRRFGDLQDALLHRIVVAYVDARSCAPAWRDRVRQAQLQLLATDRVCDLDVASIPEPAYRAEVEHQRKQKGAWCFAAAGTRIAARPTTATDGPSLEAFGEPLPLPAFPSPPPTASVPRVGASSGGGGAGLGIAAAAVLAGLLVYVSK